MTGLLPAAATAPSSLTVRVLTVRQAASWLLCEVSGFSPPDILLTWLKGRTEVDPAAFATAHPVAQPGNSTFQTWSVLHVLAAQSPGPATYTCVVRHDASRKLFNTSQSLDTGESRTGLRASGPASSQHRAGVEGQPSREPRAASWGCSQGPVPPTRRLHAGLLGVSDTCRSNPVMSHATHWTRRAEGGRHPCQTPKSNHFPPSPATRLRADQETEGPRSGCWPQCPGTSDQHRPTTGPACSPPTGQRGQRPTRVGAHRGGLGLTLPSEAIVRPSGGSIRCGKALVGQRWTP